MKVTPEQLEKAVEAGTNAGRAEDRFVANNLATCIAAAIASLPEPKDAAAVDDYVAWLCFGHLEGGGSYLSVCDSDTKGAFKVYRHSQQPLDAAAIRAQAFAEIAALTEVNKEETMRVTPEQLEKAVFAASGKWCAGLNSWEHAIAAAMQPVDGDVVPLSDCPIGLFKSVSTGTLCLKTEYGLDSYIIESGERFWGGTSSQDTLADVKVIPVAMASRPDALAIRAQAFAERDAQWGRALIAGTQSVSLTFTEETVEEFKERLTRKESTLEEKIVKILDCFPWPQEKQWRTRAQVAAEIAALMEAKK